MGSAFQLLPSAQPMGSAPEISAHLEAAGRAPEIGAHLEAAGRAPEIGARFSILSALRVCNSFHFASSLFFTLCKFVILCTFRVYYSLYFAIVYIFIQTVRLYYTPQGRGRGPGALLGACKNVNKLVRL